MAILADAVTTTADSTLPADGLRLVATPGFVVRSRRRVFRVAL